MDLKSLIRRWAYNDPITAYWLTQARLPKDYKIEVTFTEASALKALSGTFPQQLSCDFFVYDIQYTTRQTADPLANSMFGPFRSICTTMKPNISLDLQIGGCNPIQITDGYEPIELAANSPWSGSRVIREFAVMHETGVNASFQLYETIPASMLPLTVTLVAKGIILPCRQFGNVDVERACYHLSRDYGVEVPRSAEAIERIGQRLRGLPEAAGTERR
jgi:hypothetical protein